MWISEVLVFGEAVAKKKKEWKQEKALFTLSACVFAFCTFAEWLVWCIYQRETLYVNLLQALMEKDILMAEDPICLKVMGQMTASEQDNLLVFVLPTANSWSYSLHKAKALESIHLLISTATRRGVWGCCLYDLSDCGVIKAGGEGGAMHRLCWPSYTEKCCSWVSWGSGWVNRGFKCYILSQVRKYLFWNIINILGTIKWILNN